MGLCLCIYFLLYQVYNFAYICWRERSCPKVLKHIINRTCYCTNSTAHIKTYILNLLPFFLVYLVLRRSIFRRSIENCSIRRLSFEISHFDICSATFDRLGYIRSTSKKILTLKMRLLFMTKSASSQGKSKIDPMVPNRSKVVIEPRSARIECVSAERR